MRKSSSGGENHSEAQGRRRYDSPVRRQQSAETRERIVRAGAEIVHQLPAWDWRDLTFKAVGARAGVSERTVHRHFSSERRLRDAILQRLVEESGVSLEALELGNFSAVIARMYRYLSSFAASQTATPLDPAFERLDQYRRELLVGAVRRATEEWPEAEREMVAALLDMLWSVPPYEHLVRVWRLDTDRAVEAMAWLIGLIEKAIREGQRPGSADRVLA